jgi:hypothetical protein
MVKLFPPIVLQEFHLYYHQFKTQIVTSSSEFSVLSLEIFE